MAAKHFLEKINLLNFANLSYIFCSNLQITPFFIIRQKSLTEQLILQFRIMFRDIDLFWFYDIFHLTIIVSLYSSTNNIFRGVDGVPFQIFPNLYFLLGNIVLMKLSTFLVLISKLVSIQSNYFRVLKTFIAVLLDFIVPSIFCFQSLQWSWYLLRLIMFYFVFSDILVIFRISVKIGNHHCILYYIEI